VRANSNLTVIQECKNSICGENEDYMLKNVASEGEGNKNMRPLCHSHKPSPSTDLLSHIKNCE
jgi:hypothetical protein